MTSSTPPGTTPLVVRRLIRAAPAQLFDAWTQPAHLPRWFGPRDVECIGAEVDLRIGGGYRLVNRFSTGRIVTIEGTFSAIDPPHLLVYSWSIEGLTTMASELVTVRFEARGDLTEVVVIHDRMASDAVRRGHAAGWEECLDALGQYLS